MTDLTRSKPELPPETIAGFSVLQTLIPSRSYTAIAEHGREVVIKRLDDACLTHGDLHPDVRQRLARVRELAVPGAANLLSVERDGGLAYLVWDFVQGSTLNEWLTKNPDRTQRLLVARELVLIVESLHAAGIVHGALHERNIFRDAHGRLWLTHISPLLVNDVRDDVDQLNALLAKLLPDERLVIAESLRQMRLSLAGRIDARELSSLDIQPDPESRRRRRMMLIAILVAVLAASLSYAIWLWTRQAT